MIYFIGRENSQDAFPIITLEECLKYFENIQDIAVDTETTGFFPQIGEILSVQLGDSSNQFVLDTSHIDIQELKPLLENRLLLMHNAKFDLKWLYKYGIFPERVYDTFLAERIISCGLDYHRKSLNDCVIRYCGVTLDKEIRGEIHSRGIEDVEVLEYAARDVMYLHNIREAQMDRVIKENLESTIYLDNLFVPVLAYVEHCGMKLDRKKWQVKIEEDTLEVERLQKSLNNYVLDQKLEKYIDRDLTLFGEEIRCNINWNSPKQVTSLFQDLGVDVTTVDKKTGKTKTSVQADILRAQVNDFDILPLYINYKEAQKSLSSYGENFFKVLKQSLDGRIRTDYTQIMNTGRMSSGGGSYDSVNFQNIPREGKERSCFTPESGNVFVVCDYSQQEQVILANKSRDPGLIEFFTNGGGDLHCFVASKMFPELENLTVKEIKEKHPDKRYLAKTVGFTINYGGNGFTISKNLSIPLIKGEQIFNDYFKAFPSLPDYFKGQQRLALDVGYVLINEVTNRKSYIPFYSDFKSEYDEINWEEYNKEKAADSDLYKEVLKPKISRLFKTKSAISRKSLNYPVQGSGADMMKIAGVKFFKWIKENNYINKVLIPNIIHDEYVVECPENMGQEVSEKLQECMQEAGRVFCDLIPVEAKPVISKHWNH